MREPSPLSAASDLQFELYKALVNRCAAGRLNHDIANGSSKHAVVLISKLFEIAKSEVLLVTGRLTEVSSRDDVPIYADTGVISKAKDFLRTAGSRLSIIAQSGDVQGGARNRFISALTSDEKRLGQIVVYLPKETALDGTSPHFMLTDRSAYRFETGADALPSNESITAVANFGNEQNASEFSEIFFDLLGLLHTDENLAKTLEYPPPTAAA
jgi:hypothetical protein